MNDAGRGSFLARVVDRFLAGHLAAWLIVLSMVVGVAALLMTSREEEPQIVVPMADVRILAPGLPPEEVERQVATRLEKLLLQIPRVEYVYSMSLPGEALVTVRFEVGADREKSLVDIHDKLDSNRDLVPPVVAGWYVKPVEIDDVPILVATLWSERPREVDDYALRRIAEEIEIELQAVPQTQRTQVFGGRPRVVRVQLRPEALAARQTGALDVAWALQVSNLRLRGGSFDQADRSVTVDAGDLVGGVDALRDLVVNVVDGTPVHLREVADVRDGPDEPTSYTSYARGPAAGATGPPQFLPAVHIAVAKQRGANAVTVAERVTERLAELERTHLPAGVHVAITRDQGRTADDKVNELMEGLLAAIVIVIALIVYALGWREALVVAVAVPITFSLTLGVNYVLGYTINRVTLFALILALGLVVDDPIVDVENIHRHLRRGLEPPLEAVRRAVQEVRPPILLATLAVMVSFLPMLFITGMMGPYMRPMALNVPVAMAMSMAVAFAVTPWLSYHALRRHAGGEGGPDAEAGTGESEGGEDAALRRVYRRLVEPFLDDRRRARRLLWGTGGLFVAAFALAALRAVPLKMLPFDNKNELQVMVDMPEGTTLERTAAVTQRLAEAVLRAPEVRDVSLYAGLASPMDFNGLVRHSYLRQGPLVGELRVNLAEKRERAFQSHAIGLRLRPVLDEVARAAHARIALVEVPPGPPVLATLTAEVYGAPGTPYATVRRAALAVAERLRHEPAVRDVDTTVEAEDERLVFDLDQEKAALSGVSKEDVARTTRLALSGLDASYLHVPDEANPLPIRLRLPRALRSSVFALQALAVRGRPGYAKVRESVGLKDAPIPVVRLGELGRFERKPAERAIYHKNLRPLAYVYAEPVGRPPAEVIADVSADLLPPGSPPPAATKITPRSLTWRTYLWNGGGIPWSLPAGTSVNWRGEGEWKITVDVFRDLGLAFAVALLGIYLLLVYQTGSYAMPLLLMISIPLTAIGILPGFWLLDRLATHEVGGFADPIFFTATAMIGMIALSGIAVRNAILLIEFVHVALAAGTPLREALLEAGAVRTRPILLTSAAAMLAAVPITLDPIFSGLAWALIFGLTVSTAFTLLLIPVCYDLVYRHRPGHGLPPAARSEG